MINRHPNVIDLTFFVKNNKNAAQQPETAKLDPIDRDQLSPIFF